MHPPEFHAASLPDIPHDANGLRRCPKCNVIDRPARHVCEASPSKHPPRESPRADATL